MQLIYERFRKKSFNWHCMIPLNNKQICMQAKFREHILHQFNGYNSMVGIEKSLFCYYRQCVPWGIGLLCNDEYFQDFSALLNICFSQPHFKRKNLRDRKTYKIPRTGKFPSHLFQKPAPDSKLKPLIMWGYFQWCCFAPVSLVKHNLGVKVSVVWGTPCPNHSFQNRIEGGQRDPTHKTPLPHFISGRSYFMSKMHTSS